MDGVQDVWIGTEVIFHMSDVKKKPDIKALREALASGAKGKMKGKPADITFERDDSFIL